MIAITIALEVSSSMVVLTLLAESIFIEYQQCTVCLASAMENLS